MSVVGSFEQMLADFEPGVYDFTVNGECSCCGNCCSDLLPVSTHDIKRIKKYVEKHKIVEQKHVYPLAGPSFDMTCPFRSDVEKKCLIYEVRPEICRSFKCNKTKEEIRADKRMFNLKYYTVSMREVFYGYRKRIHI